MSDLTPEAARARLAVLHAEVRSDSWATGVELTKLVNFLIEDAYSRGRTEGYLEGRMNLDLYLEVD